MKHARGFPALIALLIGPTVANLDATMMNIALPSFQHAFHLSLDEVSWALHAYNIGLAVGLIPTGRLADQFGRKRLFGLGLLVFGIGTLWCSLLYAPALPAVLQTPLCFFLARGVQGVGAAALLAAGLAAAITISKSAPMWWATASSLSIAIGPILGGLLLQWLSWRWIFWVNLPLVVISAVLCRDVPESRDDVATRQIDWPGIVLLAVLLYLLISAVLEADQPDLWWEGAIVALLLFLLVELWHPAAVLDVSLFRTRSFRRVTCLMLVFNVALMAAFVVFALFLRVAHSVTEAALLLLPISVAGLVVSLWLASPVRPRWPTAQMALFGLLCMAAGLLGYRLLPSYTPPLWLLLVADILVGAGMGLCFSSLNAIGVADVAPSRLGIASGILSLMQQCGYTIGTAVLLLLVQRQGGVVLLGSFQKTWWEAALCVVGAAVWLWWSANKWS